MVVISYMCSHLSFFPLVFCRSSACCPQISDGITTFVSFEGTCRQNEHSLESDTVTNRTQVSESTHHHILRFCFPDANKLHGDIYS